MTYKSSIIIKCEISPAITKSKRFKILVKSDRGLILKVIMERTFYKAWSNFSKQSLSHCKLLVYLSLLFTSFEISKLVSCCFIYFLFNLFYSLVLPLFWTQVQWHCSRARLLLQLMPPSKTCSLLIIWCSSHSDEKCSPPSILPKLSLKMQLLNGYWARDKVE